MFKKCWLIALMFVLVLSATLLTAACDEHRSSSSTITLLSGCNRQQVSADGSATSTINPCQRLLVFSKTAAFRHTSIQNGKIALQKLASEHNFAIDLTEDSAAFTDANLAHYGAVIFLMTTGEIFNDNQQAAFERYIHAGGGFVGIHSASDTEYDWPWYGELLGAFNNVANKHSRILQTTVHVVDRTHPSTAMLPSLWVRTDEWYNFATNPRGKVHVLMTLDESTYTGGTMGADHPIAWWHDFDGGRSWYTAMGHTSESYYEPLFLAHLWGGITYAVGSGHKQTSISPRFDHVLLQQPIERTNVADVTRAKSLVLFHH